MIFLRSVFILDALRLGDVVAVTDTGCSRLVFVKETMGSSLLPPSMFAFAVGERMLVLFLLEVAVGSGAEESCLVETGVARNEDCRFISEFTTPSLDSLRCLGGRRVVGLMDCGADVELRRLRFRFLEGGAASTLQLGQCLVQKTRWSTALIMSSISCVTPMHG